MNPTTDTPRTDACPHCGAGIYALLGLGNETTYWQCDSDLKSDGSAVRSDLCREREKSQKLEAEVERLDQHIKTQNLIAREEAKILQRWKEWGMTHEEKGKQLEANLRRAIEIGEESNDSLMLWNENTRSERQRKNYVELTKLKLALNTTNK